MMAPIEKTAGEPTQDLAQFEPDPDGDGSIEQPPATAAGGEPDDPQWVVWPDPERESVWAASELSQIGATDGPKRAVR
jgi:hypothetical protein